MIGVIGKALAVFNVLLSFSVYGLSELWAGNIFFFQEDERASLILLPDKEINKGKVYCKFFS